MGRRARLHLVGLAAFAAGTLAACRRGEPPAAEVDASVAPLPPPVPGNAPTTSTTAVGTAPSAPTTPATAGTVAAAPSVDAGPPSGPSGPSGPDPASLPQTHDKPVASGATFDARVRGLWDGIASDDPERAMPFFFPLGAYEQVKAVGNPAADWRRRLVGAFKRDVHTYHGRLGEKAGEAKLVRIDVPDDRAKWVDPGEEYNKLGYYRVYGTRLVYEVGGRERTLEISSLISWRGEWYVVHLNGFK